MMTSLRTSNTRALLTASVLGTAMLLPTVATADVIVVVEPDRASRDEFAIHPIEIEPHFTFGNESVYGLVGYGAGLRVGIPLVGGHLGSVRDNIAVTFGADIVHYDNCYYQNDCGANYLMAPVAAQWNLFVARRVSLFVEGGAFVYRGWFDGCASSGGGCAAPSDFGILPTVAIGVRIHMSRLTALTLRVGYPTTTLGVSFL